MVRLSGDPGRGGGVLKWGMPPSRTPMDRLADAFDSSTSAAVGVFLVGLLLWAAGGWSIVIERDLYPSPVKVALLCAAFAIQLTAQRRPALAFGLMVALLAGDFVFGPSLPLWIALTDVIFLAVSTGSDRLSAVVGWFAVLVTAGGSLLAMAVFGLRAALYVGLIGVALTWSPLGYARAVRASRRMVGVERNAARAELAARDAERSAALGDERRRVARDLHDTVAGHLSAVAILAEVAQKNPGDTAVLQSIRAGSLAALDEMRATIDLLTAPDDTAVTARLSSLDGLIDAAHAAGGAVTLRRQDDLPLPTAVEAVITRILGETIANATKHAPGAPLAIDVRRDANRVVVTASNPIEPGKPEGQGNGLRNMSFRAESMDGTLTAGAEDGSWWVRARIPLGDR
ncbi:two-component sensor histidine kinase [Nocardia rhizosphaerihabitans]|uniref:histidine kinase n=1 Tax=Nocardia rhizosphaerihabitans TaxID=1691570 RepID=A0ABQ2KU60_9NOCA|nr:two-component sensor histidine kinase [Nocardia rhizosphaerihabitans]